MLCPCIYKSVSSLFSQYIMLSSSPSHPLSFSLSHSFFRFWHWMTLTFCMTIGAIDATFAGTAIKRKTDSKLCDSNICRVISDNKPTKNEISFLNFFPYFLPTFRKTPFLASYTHPMGDPTAPLALTTLVTSHLTNQLKKWAPCHDFHLYCNIFSVSGQFAHF